MCTHPKCLQVWHVGSMYMCVYVHIYIRRGLDVYTCMYVSCIATCNREHTCTSNNELINWAGTCIYIRSIRDEYTNVHVLRYVPNN